MNLRRTTKDKGQIKPTKFHPAEQPDDEVDDVTIDVVEEPTDDKKPKKDNK